MSALALILILLHFLIGILAVLNIMFGECDDGWKVAWIALFFLLPEISIPAYIILGLKYRENGTYERIHGEIIDRFRRQISPEEGKSIFRPAPDAPQESYRPLSNLLSACNEGNFISEGNDLEVITSGARKRELLLKDLEQAQKYIHLEYFRFGADKSGHEIRDILERKAAEGVEVRVLYPNVPNRATPRSFFDHMADRGVQVVRYTNFRKGLATFIMRINFQDHRKIAVIDGKVAYTGGMNLNDNYFYHWRDTHLRIEGPAVAALQAAFIDGFLSSGGYLSRPLDYYFEKNPHPSPAPFDGKTVQIVTDAPEYPFTATEQAYIWILENAKDYVYLQTPYFMPPDTVLGALKSAALRGVDVRLMLPLHVDTPLFDEGNQSYYRECVKAGVKIYIREGQFIHSKTLVSDDYLTIVGATNLDTRSFRINNEVNAIIYDREVAVFSRDVFLGDDALPLDYGTFENERSLWSRFLSAMMRMVSYNL